MNVTMVVQAAAGMVVTIQVRPKPAMEETRQVT